MLLRDRRIVLRIVFLILTEGGVFDDSATKLYADLVSPAIQILHFRIMIDIFTNDQPLHIASLHAGLTQVIICSTNSTKIRG